MIDFIKTYIVFILLHKWNKLSKENFDILEKHWTNKPTNGLRYWVYNKVKEKNGLLYKYPIDLEPVLAEINHTNELGISKWYEVVYYDNKWYSYDGSKTFEDGEIVAKWKYCTECF